MQAKERRDRHFKSSIGLMLNENYGEGLLPNTVQSQDFLYMPATDYPIAGRGFEFLQDRLREREPHVHKPRSIGTSDSLYQAYRRAFCQPIGVVHYDRDPLFWKSRDRPSSEHGSFKSTSSSKLRMYAAGYDGYEKGEFVPDHDPASTVKSVSTARSSKVASSSRPPSDIASVKTSAKTKRSSSENGQNGDDDVWLSKGKLEDNRHRLWTPGSEAQGFKPYSPFSDSLQDFGKTEAKFIAPEIKPEVDRTCDVMPAPVYKDALRRILDVPDTTDENGNRIKGRSPKLHGNPEYPSKVMEEKDVPNYVAWARIYPYCPLTQIEGKDKPEFIPPRGFTPSISPSRKSTISKLKDMKKEKRSIMEGIKLLSSSSKSRRGGDSQNKNNPQRGAGNSDDISKAEVETIHPSLKSLPPSLAAKLNPALQGDIMGEGKTAAKQSSRDYDIKNNVTSTNYNNSEKDNTIIQRSKYLPTDETTKQNNNLRSTPIKLSVNYDPFATRKLLDMKMKAPHGYYGGQTPTHTPTLDSSLPIKANRAWAKHYSPARIRRFLRAIGGDARTPTPEDF